MFGLEGGRVRAGVEEGYLRFGAGGGGVEESFAGMVARGEWGERRGRKAVGGRVVGTGISKNRSARNSSARPSSWYAEFVGKKFGS